MKEMIQAATLLKEIKVILKDEFVATIRKKGDELEMNFPNGQSFTVTVWENQKKRLTKAVREDIIQSIEYSLGRSETLHRQ